jgi:dUTP pyrophosphatase
MEVTRIDANAKLPTRATAGAAGYDLYSIEDKHVPVSGGATLVRTGLKMAIPPGLYGRIAPRSGLALKHGLTTGAGVIDSDYRGEVGVLLFNHGVGTYNIKKGDRIAQIIFERIATPELVEVTPDQFDGSATERSAGGYGSTGK